MFYQNIFKDILVIFCSFSLISFIQTFQWFSECNPAKAGLFLKLNRLGGEGHGESFLIFYVFNLKQTRRKVVLTLHL